MTTVLESNPAEIAGAKMSGFWTIEQLLKRTAVRVEQQIGALELAANAR